MPWGFSKNLLGCDEENLPAAGESLHFGANDRTMDRAEGGKVFWICRKRCVDGPGNWRTERIWGQMWRQMWSRDVSVAGRLFRLFMIIWNVPIMLLGLIPALWRVLSRDRNQRPAEPDRDTQ